MINKKHASTMKSSPVISVALFEKRDGSKCSHQHRASEKATSVEFGRPADHNSSIPRSRSSVPPSDIDLESGWKPVK